LLELAEHSEIEAGQLDAPPSRVGAVEASWCPLCRDHFRAGFGSCPDCGVPTLPHASG
jgi:hypothetical protein